MFKPYFNDNFRKNSEGCQEKWGYEEWSIDRDLYESEKKEEPWGENRNLGGGDIEGWVDGNSKDPGACIYNIINKSHTQSRIEFLTPLQPSDNIPKREIPKNFLEIAIKEVTERRYKNTYLWGKRERVGISLKTDSPLEGRKKRLRKKARAYAETVHNLKGYKHLGVTLTYEDGIEPEKEHLTGYFKNLKTYIRRNYGNIPYYYFWVRELQKRGALHYHFILTVPKYVKIPFPDKSWWKWGMSKVQVLKTGTKKGLTNYITAYLSKAKDFSEVVNYLEEKGMRLYGSTKDMFPLCVRYKYYPFKTLRWLLGKKYRWSLFWIKFNISRGMMYGLRSYFAGAEIDVYPLNEWEDLRWYYLGLLNSKIL